MLNFFSLRALLCLPFLCCLTAPVSCSSLAVASEGECKDDTDKLTLGNGYCNLTGRIRDSACEFESVERVNDRLGPILNKLVQTPFFKFYKLDLHKGCSLWEENHLCTMKDCTVEVIDEDEVPKELRTHALSALTVSPSGENFQPFKRCENSDMDFCDLDDDESAAGVYVNLRDNPERFTGYAGHSANRVWRSIYEENCFNLVDHIGYSPETDTASKSSQSMMHSFPFAPSSPSFGSKNKMPPLIQPGDLDKSRLENACLEKRVFYRLISGLHASISVHICQEYLNQKTGVWGPNLDCFIERISSHPERLGNIYFDYVLVLRAVNKMSSYLRKNPFCNDLARAEGRIDDTHPKSSADTTVKKLVEDVLDTGTSCSSTFDEKIMFADQSAAGLKLEFQNHFRNISTIMDCVSCEKCRLWGKIQTTGLGTALKVLFYYDEDAGKNDETSSDLTFQRTEIVALFNTLARLSESIEAIKSFRHMYKEKIDDQKRGANKKSHSEL